jgi:hypothetical protein
MKNYVSYYNENISKENNVKHVKVMKGSIKHMMKIILSIMIISIIHLLYKYVMIKRPISFTHFIKSICK